ncbi:hypothetical protein HDU67_009269 [Dinochytrium kinnereticum]|nr:hypothetical protein HDU67_009269 [Dinochytrium kinnereticum]
MFGLRRWLRKGSTTPTRINTEAMESDAKDTEDDRCVSATDSAFGVDEITRVDFISQLPSEIGIQILMLVNHFPTFAVIPCVSKAWNHLSLDNELWKALFFSHWKDLPTVAPSVSVAGSPYLASQSLLSPRSMSPQLSSSSSEASTPLVHSGAESTAIRDWKRLYHQRLTLNKNWSSGNCTAQSFTGHEDAVYCIQFDANRIVSGSRDRTVKFWNLETLQCEKTLRGHAGSVLCLQYDSRFIVTGSSDSTIIVWDFATGERLRVLVGHTSPVLDVRFNGDLIVSCSKDCTIKIWSLHDGFHLRTLEGHHAAVNAIHLNGDLVASASGDCLVKLWNARTGQHVRDFIGHSRGLACVQFSGSTIVSGSNDQTIKVWNADTGECLKTLTGHTQLVRTLCFDDERIVSGGYDQTIKVWDMKTGALIRSFDRVHTSWVFHVQMDSFRVISASQLFYSFFKTLVGEVVNVELKNDLSIRGTLVSVDQFLNIKLDDIKVNDERKFPHMISVKNCFIRGSVVRYVQLPPSAVDTALLQDATRRETK